MSNPIEIACSKFVKGQGSKSFNDGGFVETSTPVCEGKCMMHDGSLVDYAKVDTWEIGLKVSERARFYMAWSRDSFDYKKFCYDTMEEEGGFDYFEPAKSSEMLAYIDEFRPECWGYEADSKEVYLKRVKIEK